MIKLKDKDLMIESKVVSRLLKKSIPVTKKLDTIRETDCNGETNITCFETEGEKCPTETFASACMCQTQNCTTNCESQQCTKSQGQLCCDFTADNNECTIHRVSEGNEKTCICAVTDNCASIDTPCRITENESLCLCALSDDEGATCNCQAI